MDSIKNNLCSLSFPMDNTFIIRVNKKNAVLCSYIHVENLFGHLYLYIFTGNRLQDIS